MKEIDFKYFLNGVEVDGAFINWEYSSSIISKGNEIYVTCEPENISYIYGKFPDEVFNEGVFINDMLGNLLLNVSSNVSLAEPNPNKKLTIVDNGRTHIGVTNPEVTLEVKSLSNVGRPASEAISASAYMEDNYSPKKCGSIEGVKHNKHKAPLDIVQTRQFPKALRILALATAFGNKKYEATDKDFLNFKRVEGGSQTYFDAAARHNAERNEIDNDSGLPHGVHAVWNMLAALELAIEEEGINVEEFSKNYLENLHKSK